MAKEPEERYATCAALMAEAESALGLAQPTALRRRRLLLLAAAAILALAAAVVVLVVLFAPGTREENRPLPPVGANTLVRIDPARNAVADVIPAGRHPAAMAAGGSSLWIYHFGGVVSEIDSRSNAELQRVRLRRSARHQASLWAFLGRRPSSGVDRRHG